MQDHAQSPATHTHPAPEIVFKSHLPSSRALCSQSPAMRILWEPLTLAELPILFSSTLLLFCCHLLSYVVTIERQLSAVAYKRVFTWAAHSHKSHQKMQSYSAPRAFPGDKHHTKSHPHCHRGSKCPSKLSQKGSVQAPSCHRPPGTRL